MLEYRKDEGKDALLIFSTDRAKRPVVYGEKKPSCPFCKGAESTTPPTTFALPNEGEWKVRCFRNLYAIVKPEGSYRENVFPTPGFGDHEVIVETPNHAEFFQNLSDEQMELVLKAYQNRLTGLAKEPGMKYVLLFKNHGRAAGASIEHEHAQIMSMPFVPPLMQKEVEYASRFSKQHSGACFYCGLLKSEGQTNKVLENDSFVAFCPSFARFPLEFWLLPKRHLKSMLEFEGKEGKDFMKMLREMIGRLYKSTSDYIVAFHNAPAGADFHFHAEVYPRTSVWGGVELGGGLLVNSKDEKQGMEALKG